MYNYGLIREFKMKIYNVFRSLEYVGEFYQCSFSTNDKAETYILAKGYEGYDIDEFYVQEYYLDEDE